LEEARDLAAEQLREDEVVGEVVVRPLVESGELLILAVAEKGGDSRLLVLDGSGAERDRQQMLSRERELHFNRFGKMSREMAEKIASSSPEADVGAVISLLGDVPPFELPETADGTSHHDFEEWLMTARAERA